MTGAMPDLFFKVPQWLRGDARAKSLPAETRLALWYLATEGGQMPMGTLTVAEFFDNIESGAGEGADEAIANGLVGIQRGSLVLLRPPVVRVEPSASAPRADESEGPQGNHAEPSDARRKMAEKRLRYDHRHRKGPCSDVPESLSFEEWIATPAGSLVYRRRVLGEDIERVRSVRGTFVRGSVEPRNGSEPTTEPFHGTERNHHGTTTEPNPYKSSETSWIEEKKDKETDTAEPRNLHGTSERNHGTEPSRNRSTEPNGTTTERNRRRTLASPWSALTEASNNRINGMTADATTAAHINGVLNDKIDGGTLTLDDLRQFGEVVSHDGVARYFPSAKRDFVSARDALGWHRDCAPLLEAIAAWKTTKAAKPAHPPIVQPPPPQRTGKPVRFTTTPEPPKVNHG